MRARGRDGDAHVGAHDRRPIGSDVHARQADRRIHNAAAVPAPVMPGIGVPLPGPVRHVGIAAHPDPGPVLLACGLDPAGPTGRGVLRVHAYGRGTPHVHRVPRDDVDRDFGDVHVMARQPVPRRMARPHPPARPRRRDRPGTPRHGPSQERHGRRRPGTPARADRRQAA